MKYKHLEANGLSEAEQLYVETYLSTFSMVKAYAAAHPGANEKCCRNNTRRYMNREGVKAEIDRRLQEVVGEKRIVANKYLSRLDDIAMNDYSEAVPLQEQIKAMKMILDELARNEDRLTKTEQIIKISLED